MRKNKLLSVVGAIVMICCLSINAFAAPSMSGICFIDEAEFGIHSLGEAGDVSPITYQEKYNIGDIPNLSNSTSTIYYGTDLFTVEYNGRTICQNCLEEIINNYKAMQSGKATVVTYTGTGVESYTVTVPATLAPGESGDVSVSGTWASNRILSVAVPTTVTLRNSINPKDTKTLGISFNIFEQKGDNSSEILMEGTIMVEDISDALFGTWTGTITYLVLIEDFQ